MLLGDFLKFAIFGPLLEFVIASALATLWRSAFGTGSSFGVYTFEALFSRIKD
jgi:hypothetical protein